MGVPENIDALLVKYDINQEALANIAGVAPSAVTRWRQGSTIRKANLRNICEYFGLEEDDIISDRAGLAAKEHNRIVGIPGASVAVGMQTGYAPLIGSVHAGKFAEPDEYQAHTNVAIPQFLLDQDPDTFVLLTEGDCMSKAFGEGQQHLAVSPNAEAHDGSIVVVRIDGGELLVRRLRLTIDGRRLCADSYSPDYEDIVIPFDSGRIVTLAGVVKWNQSAREME